jgi:serine/threonine protein kinase
MTFHSEYRFQHYQVLKKLSEGMTSEVYQVRNMKDQRIWAAKVISRNKVENEELILNIEQEFRLMAQFDHPNIVHLKETIYDPNFFILIQEFCENGDLESALLKDALPSKMLIYSIFYQIVSALAYLHQKRISHKDLKLQNILLDSNFSPRIADFGSSQTEIPRVKPDRTTTLEYAPPEFFASSNYDAFKHDIWSLGVTLYELHRNDTPWGDGTDAEIVSRIRNVEVSYESVDPKAAEFIACCLIADPCKRASIGELMETSFFKMCKWFYEKNCLKKTPAKLFQTNQSISKTCLPKLRNLIPPPPNPSLNLARRHLNRGLQ